MEKTLSRRQFYQNINELPKEEREGALADFLDTSDQSSSQTTFSLIKNEAARGVKFISRGIANTLKGPVEIVIGVVNTADSLALGIGGIAIVTVGTILSPIPAAISREQNIVDVNRRIHALARQPRYSRLVGYPLLAIVGNASFLQIQKTLANK